MVFVMGSKPKIGLLGLGGTISSIGKGPLDLANYGDTRVIMSADEISQRVPDLTDFADIVSIPFRAMPAIDITPDDWLAINRKIHEVVESTPDLTGIVLTHGTASLEETAYFLNLTLKVDLPVVLVGSQRPFSAISSDAQLNLINAVRVAASPEARNKGVLVVMNDEIQAAREVSKTDTYRLQSFQSPGLGALGYADADRVSFYRSPTRRFMAATPFDVRPSESLPRVDVVTSYVGADATLIERCRRGRRPGHRRGRLRTRLRFAEGSRGPQERCRPRHRRGAGRPGALRARRSAGSHSRGEVRGR